VGKGRAMAREFQAAFDDIARQSELQELRKEIEDLKLKNSLKEATDDLSSYEKDVNSAVMAQTAAPAAEPAEPEPAPQPETEPKGDPA